MAVAMDMFLETQINSNWFNATECKIISINPTYRASKGWHIKESHNSVISILIADRQGEIITSYTNKPNRMTDFYERWGITLPNWKRQTSYSQTTVT